MTAHNLTLVFEDGTSIRVTANEGETVYQAAARQNVPIQTDCREGACATCRAICLSGSFELDDFSDDALTPEEEAEGGVLACRMKPHSDCVVDFPYAASLIDVDAAGPVRGTVTEVSEAARDVWRLRIRPEAPVAFLPGQYLNITVPGQDAQRSYSFASLPGEEELEFFVRRLEGGAMTGWLSGDPTGEETQLGAPLGQFYLRRPGGRIVLVAGGTGLAPMLSILGELARGEEKPEAVTLLYGTNTPDERFGAERLAELAETLPLEVRTIAVEGEERTGFVTDLFDAELIGEQTDVYLCGPPPMIDAARAWLSEAGHPASRTFAEKFLES
ncbi:2Fe-2S iron-sulfur cluster binding domain-containing protein [Aquicoccus sp. SCR17]|nr:2Fe-2S iron-sulfur cluster binding domain-containing protein [Carideicomes alvinocaridis]